MIQTVLKPISLCCDIIFEVLKIDEEMIFIL